jgi:uncharacterized protein YcbX
MPSVAWITVAPVKALALVPLDEAALGPRGVEGDREFFLVDPDGRMINDKECADLVRIRPDYDSAAGTLAFTFPDGDVVGGAVTAGDPLRTRFWADRPVEAQLVPGPWSEAVSRFVGRPLRLVRAARPGGGVDRPRGPVSILSTASLERLGEAAGVGAPVDGRRFRMLLGVDGVRPHEEDEWLGRPVRFGGAVVKPLGHVGRCAVTTQNPDTGRPDLDTLRTIRGYRDDGTEPIPFGVYGAVLEPGLVRVGDRVEPA